jgi:hypothetical protein
MRRPVVPESDPGAAVLAIRDRLSRVNEQAVRQTFDAAFAAAPLTTVWAALHALVQRLFPGFEIVAEEEAADTYLKRGEPKGRGAFFCFDPMILFYVRSGIAQQLARGLGVDDELFRKVNGWALSPTLHHNGILRKLATALIPDLKHAEVVTSFADIYSGEVLMDPTFWEIYKAALVLGYIRTEPEDYVHRLRCAVYSQADAFELARELLHQSTPYVSIYGGGVVHVHLGDGRATPTENVIKEVIVEPHPEGIGQALFERLVPQHRYKRAMRDLVLAAAANAGATDKEIEQRWAERGLLPARRSETADPEETTDRKIRQRKTHMGLERKPTGRPKGADSDPVAFEEISDANWAAVAAVLPPVRSSGRARADDRRTLNGILFVLHARCGWRDMPDRCGSHKTCARRLNTWKREGTWSRIAETLGIPPEQEG